MSADLKSLTKEEIVALFVEKGYPAFRGKQVSTWLDKGCTSFNEMTDLPPKLRHAVVVRFFILSRAT